MEQAGGGWYGGGGAGNYNGNSNARAAGGGGGSGFVWTSETASNVPSGYTVGIEYYLTDAATYAGNTSFTSTSGETETGHSGDGYARITLVSGTIRITNWKDIETQRTNETLTGQFLYNGNTITVTDTNGGTAIFSNSNDTVQAGEYAEKNSEYSDGTNTAIIPAGFTVSGATSENVIEDGLVIYLIDDKTEEEIEAIDWTDATTLATLQQTYDQFVWIPIAQGNINDMYMCQSEDGTKSCNITVQEIDGKETAYCTTHSSTLMAGRLYATSTEENYDASLTNQTYSSGNGFREPDTVSSRDDNTTYLAQLNEILGTSYSSASDLMTDLQKEYNEIVKSVYQNEGFYIGRYETSAMTNSNINATIKVVAGSDNTTNGSISGVTWYRMYAQQMKYAENKGLTSSIGSTMIQGAAYDQVMKFVDGALGGSWTFDVTSRVEARHTGELGATGDNRYDKVKNIFDLEANLYAWTTEAYASTARVERGGNYSSYMSSAASYRTVLSPSSNGVSDGTICQLYIKSNTD